MSERLIRRNSGEAARPDRTDWARVDALTDEDIERAIADDPDTWSPSQAELDAALARGPRFEVYARDGGFSWRLVASSGEVLARAGRQFASEADARAAIERLPREVLDARRDAA